MRVTKRAIASALTLVLAMALAAWLLDSNLRKFERKGASFHADFAAACDSILAQHPLGTNKTIQLSPVDPSLPKIVCDLHPLKIQISANRIWMLVDGSHADGLATVWEPAVEAHTNVWHLHINNGQGKSKVVYVTSR